MDETRLFLVRVWQRPSTFRASVRDLDHSEPRLFTDAHQLGDFLHAASTPGSAAPGDAARGPGARSDAPETPTRGTP